MIDLREPIFEWGQQVKAAIDLVNDGSHPNFEPEGLLAAAGTQGEIVNVGHHRDNNTPVYLVDFLVASGAQVVIGCLEEELTAV